MFGGPLLGVAVFIIIAVALGWGLIKLLQMQLDQATHALGQDEQQSGFDPEAVYTLKRDLLLGYLSDGRVVLFPGRDDLPEDAPRRRSAPRIADVRDRPGDFPDLIGIVEHNTRVRFVEVIEDLGNAQTHVLLRVELVDGPHATRSRPVLGMHLESVDTPEAGKPTRLIPRPDLFEAVQSQAPKP